MTEITADSGVKKQNPCVPAVELTAKHLLVSLVRFGQVPKPSRPIQDMDQCQVRHYLKKHNVYLKKE